MIEMPSGTGKTPALLSLILSHQQRVASRHELITTLPDGTPRFVPRLIYLSRTVHEVQKACCHFCC